jgi:trk system potassium uptake protein TrkA
MFHQSIAFIIIVGCGRIGAYLANQLSRQGQSVVVIDLDESSFAALSVEFSGFKVEGDATEIEVLTQSKADQADFLIAVTHDDNTNLMVAQVAKNILKVPRVLARVFDKQLEAIYRDFGVETICPTSIVGEKFLQVLTEEG